MEFRIKDCQLQADDTGLLKVGGYINVTERESEMLYNKRNGKWFKEIMKKGVFKRAIERAGKNIPLLFEHDWNKQLASIEEGSLELREDNIGLRFDAVINDESIYQQVKAGIINSCSFGFRALAEEVESINTRLEKRFVSAIELLEVSLVKNPAYVGSLCETRSYEEELKEEERAKCETPDEEERAENLDDSKAEDNKSDVAEGQDVEEKEADDKAEEEKVEAEEDEKAEDEADKRFYDEPATVEDVVEVQPEVEKDYIKKVVEELIESKLAEIKQAEVVEEEVNQELQLAKEIHEEIEKNIESQSMAQSAEVLRLRLELLKLKDIKRGI